MAKLIDSLSAPSTKTELDLFSLPPTQVSIENGFYFPARLVNSCTNEGPWQFHINADPQYLNLSKNYLWMKLKIVRADGTNMVVVEPPNAAPVEVDPMVGPINMIGKTLFKQVRVYLNGKLLIDTGDHYHYHTFLETELNYSDSAKKTQLKAALYSKDKPANQVESDDNRGFRWQSKWFAGSRVAEVMAPIHCELFQSDRLLLDNTDLHLELHRNSDSVTLLCFEEGAQNYKIQVIDMIWYVRKVEVLKSVQMALETALMRAPARYPVRRIQLTKLHVTPGRRSTPANTLFQGQIPRRIVFGFVDSDAYFGTLQKCPFRLKNNNITQVKVTAGGHMYPREPLLMNFANNQYMRPYIQLFESLGQASDDTGNAITLEDFKESRCLFVFDLTPDESDSAHWQLIKEGSLSIDVQFGADVPEPGLEMIVYAEYDNLITIDRNRNVFFDYSV